MRILGPSHLYLNRQTLRLKIGHFFGVGKIDLEGKINVCPNLDLCSPYADINNKEQVYDDASLAPEHLFNTFTTHTKDLDTWSFGSLMFNMLIGSPPPSYFKLYKDWYCMHKEVELKRPFIEPTDLSFVYDPLSGIDMDTRNERIQIIGSEQNEYLINNNKKSKNTLSSLENQSYSALIEGKGWLSPYKKLGEKSKVGDALRAKRHNEIARQLIEAMSSNSVKEKSFLGLMLDMIACCLDPKPQNRPDLNFLRGSPIFSLDGYEKENATRFAEAIFLYKDPIACITNQITKPLRRLCLDAIKNSDKPLIDLESSILTIVEKLFENVRNLSMNNVRKSEGDIAKASAPYIFLAQRIIADRVIDMIIFLCHKYTKQFNMLRKFGSSKTILKKESIGVAKTSEGRRIRFADESKVSETEHAKTDYNLSVKAQLFNSKFRSENNVLTATCELLNELVKEMHYKESVFAGYVGKVLEYVIKLLIGESYVLASDLVFMQQNEKRALEFKTFLRNKADLKEQFVPDELDKAWYALQHNQRIINYEMFWDYRSYLTVLPLYQGTLLIDNF
jgi:serine/threonine protein kinase